MALINCPECGKEGVSDSAECCPGCGYGIKAHFLKIKEDEIKRKEEIQKQAELKAVEEKRKAEAAENEKRKQEQQKKNQEFWKKNKIRIIGASAVAIILIIGFAVLNTLYLKPNSICKKAENYIAEGKYEDALNELVQVNGFGNSDELYKEAMQGIAEKNYDIAVSFMAKGELSSAYEILTGINLEFVSDKEKINNAITLVNQYKDSEWIGSWENDGFSFIRYTNVCIKDGKAYIQLTQSNSDSEGYTAEYPSGNSYYIEYAGTMDGYVKLENKNQIEFPYWSAPKGYYVWARVGSGAANEYESDYKQEPRIGMTHEQVEASTWGKPKEINKTTYAWGTSEQWVYSGYRYIYFDNGKVTAISE